MSRELHGEFGQKPMNLHMMQTELAALKAERDELREALEALMLVAEYKDMKSGETVGSLFPLRFNIARAVLKRTEAKP